MVRHLYRDFLRDAHQYTEAEEVWRRQWQRAEHLTGQKGEWRYPWLRTTSANGAPFRDGDPMFSAISADRGLAVRVIQHEPEGDDIELDFWVDEFGDEWEKVRVLVISCALSEEVVPYALDLFYSWMMEGSVRVARGPEGPVTVLPPREKPISSYPRVPA
jgi:hypothetical protein